MKFVERFWATVTCVINWVTISPVDLGYRQRPISDQAGLELLPHHPHVDISGQAGDHNGVQLANGPKFKPPGAQVGSNFECDYSAMVGWKSCLDVEGCWLVKENDPNTKLDVHSNYENNGPIGITRQYTLTAADDVINADGINFTAAKVFDKHFPGPWIQACWGDRLVITVINKMKDEGLTVHWHGIRQWNSMPMDGVSGISQCPIAPNDQFTYIWNATQYGSAWYHSHYSVQYADGLLGPMTLHGPSSKMYDEAVDPLMMTDWGHNSAWDAINTGVLKDRDILFGGPKDLVGNINRYSGSKKNTELIPPTKELVFKKNRRYLLRLINTAFDSGFIFSIDKHNLEVISADFVPIKPYTTQFIYVMIGQRYNVIVTANQFRATGANYWIRTYAPQACSDTITTAPGDLEHYALTGILRYNAEDRSDPTTPVNPGANPSDCHDEPASKLHPVVPWTVGPAANLGNKSSESFSQGGPGTLNGNTPYKLAQLSFTPDNLPGLALQVNYTDPIVKHFADPQYSWKHLEVVIPEDFKEGDWVYLTLQAFGHPIHLHGHDFAILYTGSDAPASYVCVDDATHSPTAQNPLQCFNPPRRDVVWLDVTQSTAVIAFKADNPGSWLLHCHIAFHAANGFAFQIMERQKDADALWPVNGFIWNTVTDGCSKWDKYWGQKTSEDSGI